MRVVAQVFCLGGRAATVLMVLQAPISPLTARAEDWQDPPLQRHQQAAAATRRRCAEAGRGRSRRWLRCLCKQHPHRLRTS